MLSNNLKLLGYVWEESTNVCLECAQQQFRKGELKEAGSVFLGSEAASTSCELCDQRLDGLCRECDGDGLVDMIVGIDPQDQVTVACDECRGAGR